MSSSSVDNEIKRQVTIGIVHNNDEPRLVSARATSQFLARSLQKNGFSVFLVEAGFQALTLRIASWGDVLARLWVDYAIFKRAVAVQAKKKHAFRLLFRFCLEGLRWIVRRPTKREFAVWRSITAKHVSLLWAAINSGSEWVIVLEDDSALIERTAKVFSSSLLPVLESEQTFGADVQGVFINLGGESDAELLSELRSLVTHQTLGRHELSTPLVDTVSAYAMNRKAASDFIAALTAAPELANVAIDPLMEIVFAGNGTRVVHVAPTLLAHGSSSGAFLRWAR